MTAGFNPIVLNRLDWCRYLMIVSLDDFKEDGGSILHRFGENLQQVAVLVIIDQNLQFLQDVHILCDFDGRVLQVLAQQVVVGIRNRQELATSRFQILDGCDDVASIKSDVLDSGTSVIVDVLLDLTLPQTGGRFVDRHLESIHNFTISFEV